MQRGGGNEFHHDLYAGIRPRMGMRCSRFCHVRPRLFREVYPSPHGDEMQLDRAFMVDEGITKRYPSPHGDEMQHKWFTRKAPQLRIRPRMGMRCSRYIWCETHRGVHNVVAGPRCI